MEQLSNQNQTEIEQPVATDSSQLQSQEELLAKYIEQQKLRSCPSCGEGKEIF